MNENTTDVGDHPIDAHAIDVTTSHEAVELARLRNQRRGAILRHTEGAVLNGYARPTW